MNAFPKGIVIEDIFYENQRHYLSKGWSNDLLPVDRYYSILLLQLQLVHKELCFRLLFITYICFDDSTRFAWSDVTGEIDCSNMSLPIGNIS